LEFLSLQRLLTQTLCHHCSCRYESATEDDNSGDDDGVDRKPKARSNKKKAPKKRPRARSKESLDEDTEEEEEDSFLAPAIKVETKTTPARPTRSSTIPTRASKRRSGPALDEEDGVDAEEKARPTKRSRSVVAEVEAAPAKKRRSRKKAETMEVVAPAKKSSTRGKAKKGAATGKKPAAVNTEEEVPPSKSSRDGRRSTRLTRQTAGDVANESPVVESDSKLKDPPGYEPVVSKDSQTVGPAKSPLVESDTKATGEGEGTQKEGHDHDTKPAGSERRGDLVPPPVGAGREESTDTEEETAKVDSSKKAIDEELAEKGQDGEIEETASEDDAEEGEDSEIEEDDRNWGPPIVIKSIPSSTFTCPICKEKEFYTFIEATAHEARCSKYPLLVPDS
jgi:hypothetical protein